MSYTLHIVSKSVLDTLYSINECLIDSLSVLFEVVLAWKAFGPEDGMWRLTGRRVRRGKRIK